MIKLRIRTILGYILFSWLQILLNYINYARLAFNFLHLQIRNINPTATISYDKEMCPARLIWAAVTTSKKKLILHLSSHPFSSKTNVSAKHICAARHSRLLTKRRPVQESRNFSLTERSSDCEMDIHCLSTRKPEVLCITEYYTSWRPDLVRWLHYEMCYHSSNS